MSVLFPCSEISWLHSRPRVNHARPPHHVPALLPAALLLLYHRVPCAPSLRPCPPVQVPVLLLEPPPFLPAESLPHLLLGWAVRGPNRPACPGSRAVLWTRQTASSTASPAGAAAPSCHRRVHTPGQAKKPVAKPSVFQNFRGRAAWLLILAAWPAVCAPHTHLSGCPGGQT